MKHFKTQDNKVFAFEEDGSQDHFIKPEMVAINDDEVRILTSNSPTPEQLVKGISVKRLALLTQTDWTQLPDVPQTTRENYVPYRQALRDITDQEGYPEVVVWPIAP